MLWCCVTAPCLPFLSPAFVVESLNYKEFKNAAETTLTSHLDQLGEPNSVQMIPKSRIDSCLKCVKPAFVTNARCRVRNFAPLNTVPDNQSQKNTNKNFDCLNFCFFESDTGRLSTTYISRKRPFFFLVILSLDSNSGGLENPQIRVE
jgi:hypothetical protein